MKFPCILSIALFFVIAIREVEPADGKKEENEGSQPMDLDAYIALLTKIAEISETKRNDDNEINYFLQKIPNDGKPETNALIQKIKDFVVNMLKAAPKNPHHRIEHKSFREADVWVFKMYLCLVEETTSTVQDLRHILDYLFYLPYQFENHEMTMHQIIVNIINKHAAKEPLTEDDVTYIDGKLKFMENGIIGMLSELDGFTRLSPYGSDYIIVDGILLQMCLLNRSKDAKITGNLKSIVQRVMRLHQWYYVIGGDKTYKGQDINPFKPVEPSIKSFLDKQAAVQKQLLDDSKRATDAWLNFVNSGAKKYSQDINFINSGAKKYSQDMKEKKTAEVTAFVNEYVGLWRVAVLEKYCGEVSEQYNTVRAKNDIPYKIAKPIIQRKLATREFETFEHTLFFKVHHKPIESSSKQNIDFNMYTGSKRVIE